MPLIRAAYAGMSAIIDPYGRISQRLDLEEAGVIDTRLPQPITAPLYANWGDIPFGAIFLLLSVIILLSLRNNLHRKEQ